MICPYINNFHYHEQLNVQRPDDPEYIEKYVMSDFYTQMKCQEENCAVWDKKKKRCRYNG